MDMKPLIRVLSSVALSLSTAAIGANMPSAPTGFAALVGAWKGTAQWENETGVAETETNAQLELIIAADGAISGSGNGCTLAGQVMVGDASRSRFGSSVTATGCTDPVFNGDYMRLRLERFGASMIVVRMRKGDDASEQSIAGRLVNEASAPPPAGGFDAIAGDWLGTARWKAEGSGQPHVDVDMPLTLSILSTGAVSGSGFGCTFTGTLAGNRASRSGFGGLVTAAGCDNAVFNGDFDRVRVRASGQSARIEVEFSRESAGVEVKIEGELEAQSGAGAPPPPPPPAPVSPTISGSWAGTVAWEASEHSGSSGDMSRAASQPIAFTIGDDGSFTGTGFGCSFTGMLRISANGRVSSGQITAAGCTVDAFNGKYDSVQFQRDDAALEIEIEREREDKDSSGSVKVKISGKVRRP
jgi:hypothetical protein